jgi:hypothetical protein
MTENVRNDVDVEALPQASELAQEAPTLATAIQAARPPNAGSSDSEREHKPLSAKVQVKANAAMRKLFRGLCRLLFVKIEKNESEEGSCEPHPSAPPLPDFLKVKDNGNQVLLDQAIRYFEAAQKRHETIKDKGKTILTLLVFVASFITLAANFFERGLLLLAPTVFAFATVWLFLEMFRLTWSGVPKMDQTLIDATDAHRRVMLAEGYVRAARFGDRRTDYIALVLTAARRAVALALVSVVAVTVGYALTAKRDHYEELVKRLRSEPALLNLLHGPRGIPGPKGEKGEQGSAAAPAPITPTPAPTPTPTPTTTTPIPTTAPPTTPAAPLPTAAPLPPTTSATRPPPATPAAASPPKPPP